MDGTTVESPDRKRRKTTDALPSEADELRVGPQMCFCTVTALSTVPPRLGEDVLLVRIGFWYVCRVVNVVVNSKDTSTRFVVNVSRVLNTEHGKAVFGRNVEKHDSYWMPLRHAKLDTGVSNQFVASRLAWDVSWEHLSSKSVARSSKPPQLTALRSQEKQKVITLCSHPFDHQLRGCVPHIKHATTHIRGDEFVRVLDENGEAVLSYIPPSVTKIPESTLAAANEALSRPLPRHFWSRKRGDGSPDVDIDTMRKMNPYCNYLWWDRKNGYYKQNKPCSTEARKATKDAVCTPHFFRSLSFCSLEPNQP